MSYSPAKEYTAKRAALLPEALHYRGEPNEWVRMTRPGQRLHSFLEGLAIAPDGSLYAVDVPYGRIFRIDTKTNDWSLVAQYDGQPHGLAFSRAGELVVADYVRGLLRITAAGGFEALCDRYNDEKFKGLSDLTYDTDGSIWFTDSGRTSLSDPTGRLFRLQPDGELRCVLDNVAYPNGVAISKDGAHVLLSVTRANAIWRLLRISPEARPMAGVYIQMSGGLGPDGLSVSSTGVLAVAHAQTGSVWIFSELGDPLARVWTPGGLWTTSVRFGGGDGRTLYIAEAQTGSVFEFQLSELEQMS